MTDEATPIPEAPAAPAPEAPVIAAQPGSTTEGGVLPSPQPAPVPDSAPAPVAAPGVDPTPVVAEPVVPVDPTPVVAEAAPSVPAPVPVPATPPSQAELEARRRQVDEEGGVVIGRDDTDAIVGQFADVVDGPYAGRYVVYQRTLTSGDDGYPLTVLVKTRDARDEQLVVDYAHLRPAETGGR